MNENDLLHQMLYTGGSALLGLLGVGLGGLTNAWAGKVRNQTLAQVIRNTNDIVMNVVKSVYEIHVRPRTKHHALSGPQRRHVRATALREVKEHLGYEGIKNLQRAFGNDVDIDTVLGHHLEAAVRDLKDKRAGRLAEAPPNNPLLVPQRGHTPPPPLTLPRDSSHIKGYEPPTNPKTPL